MDEQELQLILEEGEGQEIEFKESLANLDKELVAFANSCGGRIFVDITDGREIKGREHGSPTGSSPRFRTPPATAIHKSISSWRVFGTF